MERTELSLDVTRLDKRVAMLVAYLVLEGPTTRSRLAGLLWPDAPERTARNNLAQAVRRLHRAAGGEIVSGHDVIALEDADSDVSELERWLASDAPLDGPVPAPRTFGELLSGHDLEGDADAWLRMARARVARTCANVAAEASRRAAAAGARDDALRWAESWTTLEPLSEHAHLHLVSLWLARGDAPAAMAAYDRSRKLFARELGMPPSPAMLEVLRAIRRGGTSAGAPSPRAPALPAITHPMLVGRAAAWERLHQARREGGGVIVRGAPGLGKTRLIRDFCASAGKALVIEGRPGDGPVPFATLARALRSNARAFRDLPPWARVELEHLCPVLVEHGATSDVRASGPRDRLRSAEAVALAVARLAETGTASLVVDDAQWLDAASAELCLWLVERCWTGELPLFAVVAHRERELPATVRRALDLAESARLASSFELEPLAVSEVEELVLSFGVPDLVQHSRAIAEVSLGVPLFVIEIARGFVEAAAPSPGAARLPVSARMKALIAQRLNGLSEAAVRLARVAAVVDADLDLELAAAVLDERPLELSAPWAELEEAAVLARDRFTHDVLAEVVREGTPLAVVRHIQSRVANHLAAHGAEPARVAEALLAADRRSDAVPHLLAAAARARALSEITTATELFEKAAHILESEGRIEAACAALHECARSVLGERGPAIASWIERIARTPDDQARAATSRASIELERGDVRVAIDAARRGEGLATERVLVAQAQQQVFEGSLRLGDLETAEAALVRLEASAPATPDTWLKISALFNRGELLAARGDHGAAIGRFEAALDMLERWGELRAARARGLAAIAFSRLARGEVDEAERVLSGAPAVHPSVAYSFAHAQVARAAVALARDDVPAARTALEALPDDVPTRYRDLAAPLEAEVARRGGGAVSG